MRSFLLNREGNKFSTGDPDFIQMDFSPLLVLALVREIPRGVERSQELPQNDSDQQTGW